MLFDALPVVLFGLIWIGAATLLRRKKSRSAVYLLFFTVFYVYLFKVLDYTLLQFQTLLLLRYLRPNLILRGQSAGEELNLVPLVSLTLQDAETSLLNVLLFVPFGFGLPFVTSLRMKSVVGIGALFSLSIELLQLATGALAGITFRIADVNDVVFNTVGVVIGYVLFVGFGRAYRGASRSRPTPANPVLRYVAERPQISERAR